MAIRFWQHHQHRMCTGKALGTSTFLVESPWSRAVDDTFVSEEGRSERSADCKWKLNSRHDSAQTNCDVTYCRVRSPPASRTVTIRIRYGATALPFEGGTSGTVAGLSVVRVQQLHSASACFITYTEKRIALPSFGHTSTGKTRT